jgi:predicted transposase/invertase (TIGR01784 family)
MEHMNLILEIAVRRDAIFYTIFQRFPGLFFELLGQSQAIAQHYRFAAVEVKEPTFRIDGVFLPLETATSKVVFFAEVQFQKDETLYDRFFAESMQYLYRNPLYDDWYGVVIFRSRRTEPKNQHLHRSLLSGSQVQRIYLNELARQDCSLGVRTILLTLATRKKMPEQARALIAAVRQQENTDLPKQEIIDTIARIVTYKFSKLSHAEIEAMLRFSLEEPRAFKELREKGHQEGRQEEVMLLASRLLFRKFGTLEVALEHQVQQLSIEELEALVEALLDFQSVADLSAWLQPA